MCKGDWRDCRISYFKHGSGYEEKFERTSLFLFISLA